MAEIVSSTINPLTFITGQRSPGQFAFSRGRVFEGIGLCEGVMGGHCSSFSIKFMFKKKLEDQILSHLVKQ
jgi:hypothetical protein